MNATDIIRRRFIRPLEGKRTGIIGVELEFPLVNDAKKPIDINIALSLLEHFLHCGFSVAERTEDGHPAFIENSDGDVLSFDNSYNNFEFSMNCGNDLMAIASRFEGYLSTADTYLRHHNYQLVGRGTNPNAKCIEQSHVNYAVYNMIDEFLHTGGEHNFPDFPAYLSSVQTHLDIDFDEIPKAFNLFAKIAFARVLLFGNSPGFNGEKVLCYRDYLWEKSAFGCVGGITGKVDNEIKSIDDIVDSFLNRKIFNIRRNGKYVLIAPTPIRDYFNQCDAREEDIECFLSFRDVELTYRGTLEVRGDCAQPLDDAFMPPAFNLGLTHNLDRAVALTDEFFIANSITKNNTDLRNDAIASGTVDGVDDNALSEYLLKLCKISSNGLIGRGKNEQSLLKGIFDRAMTLTCPAK